MSVGGIVVPVIKAELSQLKTWLRYCPSSGVEQRTVFLSLDQVWDGEDKKSVLNTFSRSALSREKWRLEFIDCKMSSEESFYEKDAKKEIDLDRFPYGQKSGPNMQFFRTLRAMEAVATTLGAILLMEVDAFPVVDDWMARIDSGLARLPNGILIAGGCYAGESHLSDQIRSHFNGNSVYFVGRKDFYRFLDCWEELLLNANRIVPFLAYDIVIPWFVNYRKTNPKVASLEGDRTRFLEECFNSRMADISQLLVNYGGPAENDEKYVLDVFRFVDQYPKAVVVHGKCFHESVFKIRLAKKNSDRKSPVNILHDMICDGFYEESILFGVGRLEIVSRIAKRIEKLSDDQKSVVQRNWC